MKLINRESEKLDDKEFTVVLTGLEVAALYYSMGEVSHAEVVTGIKYNFPDTFSQPDDIKEYELFKQMGEVLNGNS